MREIERIYRWNKPLASSLRSIIRRYAEKLREKGFDEVKIMNFCGTHEWTTVHFGLRSLMPDGVSLVAGPGCPVCITPSLYVSQAISLAEEGVAIYTFGDAYKLPTTRPVDGMRSLADAKSSGYDVRVVYSFSDALREAKDGKESVFLAIGFETTAPSYAFPLKLGMVPENLSLLPALRLTPPVARHVVFRTKELGEKPVDGIIAPGHVSAITGAKPWDELGRELGLPVVVTGFEPIDVLLAVAQILKMLYKGEVGGRLEYRRVVSWEGNVLAQRRIREVFEVVDAGWRGLGYVPASGLSLREEYRDHDALARYSLRHPTEEEVERDIREGCLCHRVIMGLSKPTDCPLFMRKCTPEEPWGPCMVSVEGACSVWARFGGTFQEELRELGTCV